MADEKIECYTCDNCSKFFDRKQEGFEEPIEIGNNIYCSLCAKKIQEKKVDIWKISGG